MRSKNLRSRRKDKLPAMLRPLFWDYDFQNLNWEKDRDVITARVLASGTWEAATWVRARLGDNALRDWIERRRGRGLSPQQLRFWELILGLPHRQVTTWLTAEERKIWDERIHPKCSGTLTGARSNKPCSNG